MKHLTKCRIALLCLVLFLAGCEQPETTVAETTQRPLTAEEKYELACEEAERAPNLILSYTLSETRQVGQDTYTETVTGTASFAGIGGKDMEAVVEEQLHYGSYQSTYKEVYCDGDAFAEVNGSAFTADLTAEEFRQRQMRAVLLEYGLYASVTETSVDGAAVLTFAQPSAAESWLALPSGAQLLSAGGSVTFSSQGSLTQSDYQIDYMLGQTHYHTQVTVRITMPKSLDLGAIHSEHFENCPELQELDAPKRLLQVVGDVYTTLALRCKATESIYSEAIPLTYSQKSVYRLQGAGENMTAGADYTIKLTDYRGEVETDLRQDSYENGTYTTAAEGTTQQSAITAERMRQYYEDAILSALLAPKYLHDATSWTGVSEYHLELTGNDAFAEDLIRDIAEFLQVELDADNVKIAADGCGGYVDIDKETGLPVSMGLFLNCTHTVEEIEYVFTYTLEQELTLSDFE